MSQLAETTSIASIQQNTTPAWLVLPFAVLLCMIATGPLLYARFWHKHYPKVALILAGLVGEYYLLVLHDFHKPVEALMEYIQFITLIGALYIASGGIFIRINKLGTPFTNLGVLCTGAVLANLIGTTGASMLLIKPYMRLNKARIRVYHMSSLYGWSAMWAGRLHPLAIRRFF